MYATLSMRFLRSLRLNLFSGFRLAALGLLLLPGCSRPHETTPDLQGERIASLAPSLTEIICAVGAERQLVGRTSVCDYPPDITKAIPVIGGFGAPSLDLLLKIRPTLVLDIDLADAALGDAIEQAGLTRRRIACSTVDDIPRAILQIGRLTHQDDQARTLADTIRTGIAGLRAKATGRQAAGHLAPLVFVEIWDEPLTTVGKQSFLSDLITLAGGRNLGDEITDRAYFTVSAEWIIARNPAVIICMYMSRGEKTEGQKSEVSDQRSAISNPKSSPAWRRVATRTGWAGIAAVKNRRVYGNLNNNVVLRPGPRMLEGIEDLRLCIEDSQRHDDRNTGRK